MYKNLSDQSLVMLTLAGEQSAYEELVIRYQKAVISAAALVTHNLNMAEDSAQDAFITAWIKLNMLREPEKYGAWVCRIAKNCAKNTVMRFQSFISLEDNENYIAGHTEQESPEDTYKLSEENSMLHESIEKLPEKVRRIIHLHYFEDLSVSEIAEKMGISSGTVKWQLHEGRKRIRKELCAMNEEYNDTLVQRVMKKVEELKQWQFKNSKNGFNKVYKEVLKEVEELPESMDKYHALADVLMRGWWWSGGEKTDALFERIREAAETGKNDDVMEFVAAEEDNKLYGSAKIEFIRETQIPKLEKLGFKKALASEWYWLGRTYFEEEQQNEKGFEAYERVMSTVDSSNLYYSYAKGSAEIEKMCDKEFGDIDYNRYNAITSAAELHISDGALRRWDSKRYCKGGLYSTDLEADHIFHNASLCDGLFTVKDLKPGEKYIGSDGTELEFTSKGINVTTPCGNFEDCELWTVALNGDVYKNYYKNGVGIVKFEREYNGLTETRLLKSYEIKGGSGIIPLFKGNRWEYTASYNPEFQKQKSLYTVEYFDEKTAVLYGISSTQRIRYDDNSWLDMILQIRNEYWKKTGYNENTIADVSYPIKRARQLAKTPLEKAHTKAACSAAERILATDPRFNPNYTESGHWNFFVRDVVNKTEEKIVITNDFRWDFEWKHITSLSKSHPIYSILFNDIYAILQDGTGCIWNRKWAEGYKETVTAEPWKGTFIKTDISCENAGTVETKAGTFGGCIKLSLDIGNYGEFVEYRSGKKEYYFAPKIGIVKTVNYHEYMKSVYELAEYEGEGEGYMPVEDGFVRKYEAVGLTDGYVAGAEYTYAADSEGRVYIFEDKLGVRKKPEIITYYSSIAGEISEDDLWNQGKHDESRLRHDINNFNLLVHSVSRNGRSWCAPERRTAQEKYCMSIYEMLGEGGDVPRAWLGHYAYSCFIAACSMMGSGNTEEGYEYLDRTFGLFKKWFEIPDGELLETGNKLIFGGIKVVKGENAIELPDGTREPIRTELQNIFHYDRDLMYYGMTALHGWEWFNGVREEERFKKAIERAKEFIV